MLVVLMSAEEFMDKHAETLPSVNAAAARRMLRDVLRDLGDNGAAQFGAHARAMSGTQLRDELRERLRLEEMQPVVAIARAKLLGASTENMQKFALPVKAAKDLDLLTAARAMREAAFEYRAVFEEELGNDFLARFDDAVTACENALAERNGSQLERIRATAGLAATRRKARELLGVLNALVVREARGRREVIAEWEMLRRVPKKPGVPQGVGRMEAAA
jgi:hypothetical protein